MSARSQALSLFKRSMRLAERFHDPLVQRKVTECIEMYYSRWSPMYENVSDLAWHAEIRHRFNTLLMKVWLTRMKLEKSQCRKSCSRFALQSNFFGWKHSSLLWKKDGIKGSSIQTSPTFLFRRIPLLVVRFSICFIRLFVGVKDVPIQNSKRRPDFVCGRNNWAQKQS